MNSEKTEVVGALISSILDETLPLIRERLASVDNMPDPRSPLGECGIVDCAETVSDYLGRDEYSVALEHLITVIGSADLPITRSTYDRIGETATTIGMERSSWTKIQPDSDPINSLEDLRQFVDKSFSVSFKKLNKEYSLSDEEKPFAGAFLDCVEIANVEEVVNLIGQLQPAGQMRCHTPRYSMEFHGHFPTVEFAPCFKCNNAKTRIGRSFGWIKFDGQSDAAVELYEWLQVQASGCD